MGIYARKMVARGHAGFPDVMLARDGWVVLVKLKNPNGLGKLSPKQEHEIGLLRDAGVEVRVIDSKGACDDMVSRMVRGPIYGDRGYGGRGYGGK